MESGMNPRRRWLLRPLSWHSSGCRQVRLTAPEQSTATQAPLILCSASVGRQIWAVRLGHRRFGCTCNWNFISVGDSLAKSSCPAGCPCLCNSVVRATLSGVEAGGAALGLHEEFACRVCAALVGFLQILVTCSDGTCHALSCMCVIQALTNMFRVGDVITVEQFWSCQEVYS